MNAAFNLLKTALPTARAGSDYFHKIIITRGVAPYNIVVQGKIPGLEIFYISLDESTHEIIIQGMPARFGEYNFTITMIDSKEDIYNKSYTLKITLDNLLDYLNDLLHQAIYLLENYNEFEYEWYVRDFHKIQYYYPLINNSDAINLLDSIFVGSQVILANTYINIDDALDIIIKTLPITIRFIQNL